MKTVDLYRYFDSDGVVITPDRREPADPPYCSRLIADEGYVLTDGTHDTPCVDTHTPQIYTEKTVE